MFCKVYLSIVEEQLIYAPDSLIVIGILLYLGSLIKNEKYKNLYLILWAVITLGFHFSTCYTSLLKTKEGLTGVIYNVQLLPIYFCNFIMYLNFITALWLDKKTRIFNNLATFCAYAGVFGALINLIFVPPVFKDYGKLQSAFSHSFMLLTSLYLFVGGYVKVNVFNIIPATFGLLLTGIVGGLVELLYYLKGYPSPNSMFLVKGPPNLEGFSGYYMGLIFLALIFIIDVIYEFITKKDENLRWYKNISDISLYLKIKIKDSK